jgi:osmoprotectant transport system permease protein
VNLAAASQLGAFPGAIRFIGDHGGFLAGKAVEQLVLSGASLGVALAVALPIGILLGHFHRGSFIAIGASIVARALPILVLIGIFLTVLGIGFLNNMVALAVLATGPMLTSSYLAVDGVDREVVEAARGMGMSRPQILARVELPLGVPLLLAGIRIAAVTVVATSTIAAVDGGGGLGDVIVNQASYRLQGVIGASLCVMVLSAAVWLTLIAVQYMVTPRGLRMATLNSAINYGEERL